MFNFFKSNEATKHSITKARSAYKASKKEETKRRKHFNKLFQKIFHNLELEGRYILSLAEMKEINGDWIPGDLNVVNEDSDYSLRDSFDQNYEYHGNFGMFMDEVFEAGLVVKHTWRKQRPGVNNGIGWTVDSLILKLPDAEN